MENLLYSEEDIISGNRKYIAEYHVKMDDYFENVELLVAAVWRDDSPFKQMFKKLNIEKVMELACGRGRHVPQYMAYSQEIMLVDILKKNIDYCRERFSGEFKIHYCVNNGFDLQELETNRVLKSGGRALFHHSNNTEDYRITFSTGRFGRNYMSKQLFAYLANRAGLTVLEQRLIDWSGEKELDCLTLVEKP